MAIYKWDKLLNVDKSVHQVHEPQLRGPWDDPPIASDHFMDFLGEIEW